MTDVAPVAARLTWAVPQDWHTTEAIEAARALLSTEERERCGRFRFDDHRHIYLVAHALARRCLSEGTDVAPEDWRFEAGEWGRPEVVGPEDAPARRFNLSHTKGLVAVVVHPTAECGVDVEHNNPRRSTLAIARRFFATREHQALQALPEADQPERFYALWTLKESYIKARGMGMALRLGGFCFDLDRPGPLQMSADADIDADPGRWQFQRFLPIEGHPMALALERPFPGLDIPIVVTRAQP